MSQSQSKLSSFKRPFREDTDNFSSRSVTNSSVSQIFKSQKKPAVQQSKISNKESEESQPSSPKRRKNSVTPNKKTDSVAKVAKRLQPEKQKELPAVSVKKNNWIGQYRCVDESVENVLFDLLYFIVRHSKGDGEEEIVMVPETWVDLENKYFVFPPEDPISGHPSNWSNLIFKRSRNPMSQWKEIKMDAMLTEIALEFPAAKSELKIYFHALATGNWDAENYYGPNNEARPRDPQCRPSSERVPFYNSAQVSQSSLQPNTSKAGKGKSLKTTQTVNRDNVVHPDEYFNPLPGTSTSDNANFPVPGNGGTSLTDWVNMATEFVPTGGIQRAMETELNQTCLSCGRGLSNELAAFRDEIKKLISDLQSKIENIGNAKEQVRGDPEDITYFRSVVDDFLDGTPLPFTNYGDVQALDKAIKADKDFAVSLCKILIHETRGLSTISAVAKALLTSLISRKLCTKVQWKLRKNDARPPIGDLFYFTGLMGVVLSIFYEDNFSAPADDKPNAKKSMKTGQVISAIQEARKVTALQYRKQFSGDPETEDEFEDFDNYNDDEPEVRHTSKRNSVVRLNSAIRILTLAVKSYKRHD